MEWYRSPHPPCLLSRQGDLSPAGRGGVAARVEMLNLLGDDIEAWAKLAQEPDTRLHLYGKREARPGRKMGHVNKLKPL